MNTSVETEEENFLEFDEFHIQHANFSDFTDIGATLSSDFGSMEMADHSFGEVEFEAKYRSIGVVSDASPCLLTRQEPVTSKAQLVMSGDSKFGETIFTRLDASKEGSSTKAPQVEVIPNGGAAAKPSGPITVPKEPFYVAPSTHFLTKMNVGDIKARVELELNKQECVSFEFTNSKCRWEGVYLFGSSRCKFEINVYKRLDGGHIVEGNRLSGDSLAFVNIYQAIRNAFIPESSVSPIVALPIPGFSTEASKSEIDSSIDSVLSMANSGICEAQLGASQIFCDIFSRSDSAHLISKYAECLTALIELVNVEFESCNQHAICALAHMSSSHGCQQVLMQNKNFMKTILPLCSDGKYDSIEMRRECARLLANLSSCGAKQVVASAGLNDVREWVRSVGDLQDDRLRMHSERAKKSLEKCLSTGIGIA